MVYPLATGANPVFQSSHMDRISVFLLVFCTICSLAISCQPKLLLYVTTVFTLVIAGSAGYIFPSLKTMWWISYGQIFLLSLPALYYLGRQELARTVLCPKISKTILALLFAFIFTAFLSSILAKFPLKQTITSFKSYFMMGGLWFFLALYPIKDKCIVRWLKLLFGIGLLQIFPVLYQYLFIRSWRLEHNINPMDAADSVVGTFGGSQTAGGLGAVLAFYLILCLIVWLAFTKSRRFFWKKDGPVVFLLWLPILFMEVKAAVIYLPVAIITLYREYSYQRPKKFLRILLLLSVVVSVMVLSLELLHYRTSLKKGNFTHHIVHAFSYSFKSRSGNSAMAEKGRFSRVSVLQFWKEKHGLKNPVVTLLGHGLGSSRTQGLVTGSEAVRWSGVDIDYSGLSTFLWEVGLLGTMIFAAIILLMYILAGRLSQHVRLADWQRSLAAGLQAVMPLVLLSLPYRNDIPFAAPMMFITMGVFGLIFWLNNQGAENAL